MIQKHYHIITKHNKQLQQDPLYTFIDYLNCADYHRICIHSQRRNIIMTIHKRGVRAGKRDKPHISSCIML